MRFASRRFGFQIDLRSPIRIFGPMPKNWECATLSCPKQWVPVRLSDTGRCNFCDRSLRRRNPHG